MRPITPSSLKWLIDKQVRLAGQLQRKREELAHHKQHAAACKKEIGELQKLLASVEETMRLHEIQIDPAELRPIRPHCNERVAPHGAMSRTIRRALSLSPNRTASTPELLVAVLKAVPFTPTDYEVERIHQCLRVRLCIMTQKGLLERLPPDGPCTPRQWRLPPSHEVDP